MWKFDQLAPPPPPPRRKDKKKPKSKNKDTYEHAKLRSTKDGEIATMYVPSKTPPKQKQVEDIIDPELRYTFQRNFQFIQKVFSIDPYLKPLPAPLAQSMGRSLGFFTSIFTQFF
ncbi:hypothetical protein KI387_017011, partial [Taxus chinensis]